MKVAVYNQQGKEVAQVALDATLFAVEPKEAVIHQVVVGLQHNARKPLAHTKGRSAVRGGGRKPWKQKGTGRARAGSSRSPIWRGGGVTFGPTKERNFAVKINKKMKRAALRMILSDKAKHDRLIVVDSLQLPGEEVKTKQLATMLAALPVKQQKVLVALTKAETGLIRAARNLSQVQAVGAQSLSVLDLLRYRYVLLSQDSLAAIQSFYGGEQTTEPPAAAPDKEAVTEATADKE